MPGGRGYVNVIDPFTGARVRMVIFDVNNNNNFGDDKFNNKEISSFDLGVGMPSEPVLVGDRLIVGGSDGTMASVKVNVGARKTGRLSWREIILK